MSNQTFPISQTAENIAPFHVMKLLGEAKALEAQGKPVIHLEIGEPDFPSLPCVHDAVTKAISEGKTHYTPTLGLPELRDKLSEFYRSFYHAEVPADCIMITPGSSSGLHLLLTAILNAGDKVLMTDPTYPCNRQFVKLLQGEIVSVPVTSDTDFQLNAELLAAHWQPGIKLVMVASPSNPTGTIIEQKELIAMAQFLAERQAYLLVDEIYQGLVYERPAESILANKNLPNNVLVINSFSKFFGMTGWRLGWAVAPQYLIPVLDRLGQNLFLAAPTPSQYGALRVLEEDALNELETRRHIFEDRRNRLFDAMTKAGFQLPSKPQGAFYLYWDVSELTQDAEHFCRTCLEETGVVITPGKDFGHKQAHKFVRIAYTTSIDRLLEAVALLKNFVSDYSKY